MKISRFVHGGIMVNYRCNAACRHCLYACSPSRREGYITRETVKNISRILLKGRIGSVHIGGGEPFLDFEGLLLAIRELADAGVRLDYIETNAFWAKNSNCSEQLLQLAQEGVDALCISIDPFHAEYVPWEYPLELARACEKNGMGYFLWKREFVNILSRLDGKKRHARSGIEAALGSGYIEKTASAYGIRKGGRAVNIEEEGGTFRPLAEILDSASGDGPCRGLLSTDHFHADMDGCFIPPGCTGLRLPLEETLSGTEEGRYPVFEALYTGGIAALYRLALGHGFREDQRGYTSKCSLCFHIRRHLASGGGGQIFAELDEDFYREALDHYLR